MKKVWKDEVEKRASITMRRLKSRTQANFTFLEDKLQNTTPETRYRVCNDHKGPKVLLSACEIKTQRDCKGMGSNWQPVCPRAFCSCVFIQFGTLKHVARTVMYGATRIFKSFLSIPCAAVNHSARWLLKECALISGLSQTDSWKKTVTWIMSVLMFKNKGWNSDS